MTTTTSPSTTAAPTRGRGPGIAPGGRWPVVTRWFTVVAVVVQAALTAPHMLLVERAQRRAVLARPFGGAGTVDA